MRSFGVLTPVSDPGRGASGGNGRSRGSRANTVEFRAYVDRTLGYTL